MALFGAPIAHEDHAQRACYAALHLRDALKEYAERLRLDRGISFGVRMGLNSGDVIVGKIGDDLRMDYTAQGHAVGLAQRMEQLAGPERIYLSEHTQRLVAGYFKLRDLGTSTIAGAGSPLGVYELESANTARTRLDVSRARGLSRFVGRTDETRTLRAALDRARDGHGQVVGVVGEPGVGKSRLCFEFVEHCRREGIPVYKANCPAHGRNIPLIPILELFRHYFGITTLDSAAQCQQKIAGAMVLLDPALQDTLPVLFEFMGVAVPDRALSALNVEARQRRLFALLRQIYRIQAERGVSSVVLIDDLHWVDPASDAFVAQMVEATAENSRNLLLLNFRPEYTATWMRRAHYQQLPLVPLPTEALQALLESLLGRDPSLGDLAQRITQWTAGNPFYTEELVLELVEAKSLAGAPGAYRLMTDIDALPVPTNVRAVLAARIDRLGESAKYVLQMAAVIGKNFAEPVLSAVLFPPLAKGGSGGISSGTEIPHSPPLIKGEEDLNAALRTLIESEFLYEQALYPVVEYAFKHPLTQEVALGSQLRERRRQLHARVAAALEQHHTAHLEEHAALLAHHYAEANEARHAAHWYRRAAEWVIRTDFVAAYRHWERVRSLLHGHPVDGDTAALGIAACTQLLSLGWRVGMSLEQSREIYEQGQTLVQAIGDQRGALILAQAYILAPYGAGDIATYCRLARENYAAALAFDDLDIQANACGFLLDSLSLTAQLPAALKCADDALARFPRHSPSANWTMGANPYGMFSLWRGWCLFMMGQITAGLDELDRGLRYAEEDGTPELAGWALWGATEAHVHAHESDRALNRARQFEQISRRLGEAPNLVAMADVALSYAYLAAGRAHDAIQSARAALDIHQRVELVHAGISATLLAEALLATGDLTAAEAAAREAIALCQRLQRGTYEVTAHGVMARALLRRDGLAAQDAIDHALAAASALIERTGARLLAPALCEWKAELAVAHGDHVSRARLLHEAQDAYLEFGAPGQAARLAAMLD